MKTPRSQAVSAKKVRELLNDNQWVKDEDFTHQMATLTKRLSSEAIYRHSQGKVLHVFLDGNGRLYESSNDFVLLLQNIETTANERPRHILEGRLPQGKAFIEQVPQLVDELALLLQLDRKDLDRSVISLEKVDSAVRRIGFQPCLEKPIFPALVAYVGEVIRQVTGGTWEIHLSSQDSLTWEPWIVSPDGSYRSPFFVVYINLDEPHPFSITGSTRSEIASRGEHL